MDKFFDSLLQEIDRYTGTVNLEGENIIPGCREMTKFLKEKMVELKDFALSHKFKDDAEEIRFFKVPKAADTRTAALLLQAIPDRE